MVAIEDQRLACYRLEPVARFDLGPCQWCGRCRWRSRHRCRRSVPIRRQSSSPPKSGVSSRGVEAAANKKFLPHWSLYCSWAYNDATYDDDLQPLGGARIPTKGKQVVASPRHVGNAELDYDDGTLSAHYR
ncbi:hypothetical protein ABIC65_002562 [Sphingomonas trueperi]|uniref:hypothetical protein n=1 Tax=Sphingomonas trueperi TaxID=53317 RepID=UPI00339AA1CB